MKRNLENLVVIKCTIIIFLFASFSCSETPTEPEKIKDPREYVWSVDTIKYPEEDGVVQSLIGSIWGSSENDVYITGHADTGNRIFHYNGSAWEVIDKGSNNIATSFRSEWVYGFSNNDIWFAGNKQATFGTPLFPEHVSALIHYNGSKWEMHELPVEGRFFYTWGKSSNSLWACGDRGLVGHYDGKNWEIDTIQIAAGSDENFFIRSIIEYNNIPYAIGFKVPTLYFCKKNNDNWEVVDSVETTYLSEYPFGSSVLFRTKSNKLWSYGRGIWEYNNDNSWTKIITIENGVTGLTEYTDGKYIIINPNGKVYHYDGVNLEEIKDFNERTYEVWANSKECFIVVNKPGGGIYSSTVVYHGK